MSTTKFEAADAARPPLPAETCPKIDRCSTLADAIAGDVETVRAGLRQARAKACHEAADDLEDVVHNLSVVRDRLEDLRADNAALRSATFYWRSLAQDCLAGEADGPLELEAVKAWARSASLAELEEIGLTIKAHCVELGEQLAGATVN